MPDPSLLEIVHREARVRAAEAMRAWVEEPSDPTKRQEFLWAMQAMETTQKALRQQERQSWKTGQLSLQGVA
jgi:hypothetical protein